MSRSDIAVSVRGLSKAYTIAHNATRHTTAGEALMHRLRNPLQRAEKETFWALKDVSFDIQKGDVVGIIGRNGAGKSTLLKILSQITEPTSGTIDLYGRVGSLLEVGTGFHPELSGRENIFLNGAILGMRRREIEKQFDAIVDFAEVEQFLDTPVKRYSSGMYVRLAFAVAAHLDPEILVVDEVLAVGDAQFQKKCLGKMGEVAQEGRTVLFVSHNIGAVAELCSTGVLLQKGKIIMISSVGETLTKYLRENSQMQRVDLLSIAGTQVAAGRFKLASVETRNQVGELCSSFKCGEMITVRVLVLSARGTEISLGIGVRDFSGNQILHFNNRDAGEVLINDQDSGYFELKFQNILNNGEYYLTLWLGDSRLLAQHYVFNCMRFISESSLSLSKGLVVQPAYWSSIKDDAAIL